jgi:FlaA1/EpsC-like NDP-sugar epimerase
MIELTGLTVREEGSSEGDIEIDVVGLRPGEKLYEELLIGDNPEPTSHARILKANEQFMRWPELEVQLESLKADLGVDELTSLRQKICKLVPEFAAERELVDWVKMERASA